MDPTVQVSLITLLGTIVSVVGYVVAQRTARHRRAQLQRQDAILDQLTPTTGKRFADELVENRRATLAVASWLSDHETDPDAHRKVPHAHTA